MRMVNLTSHKVRELSPEDLGVRLPSDAPPEVAPGVFPVPEPDAPGPEIDEDDPILMTVRDLLTIYGGVLFAGPPGTSKSYYAEQVALMIAGAPERIRLVQFHPSYQYEDFIEGYVATDQGYVLLPKHFVLLCDDAAKDPTHRYVIVIDELSRSDPGRVFGEALTYIERTKRGKRFSLASGRKLVVPPNVDIVATMNPIDRGVDEVDAALSRRFAKYAMEPNANLLDEFLIKAGMDEALRARVIAFFRKVNETATVARNPQAALGQTYFLGVRDLADLNRLWEHQLSFHFAHAYQLDPEGFAAVRRLWDEIARAPRSTESTTMTSDSPS